MKSPKGPLFLLWDEAHLWALLLCEGLSRLGLPFTPVRAAMIADGLLSRDRPAILVTPGGFSRRKSEALGPPGRQAIRDYVASGGVYLGFCGGAGLALSEEGGLGLCPCARLAFPSRLEHFASGHVEVDLDLDSDLAPPGFPGRVPAPVWWPARFAPVGKTRPEHGPVSILAAYAGPGPDFMLADLPVGRLPPAALRAWKERFGVDLDPAFLAGQPCVVEGRYGHGRFVLSHAHLETPGSPWANAWLAHLLATLAGHAATPGHGRPDPDAPWELDAAPPLWDDPVLSSAAEGLFAVIDLGRDHGLFFRRNGWLLGWKPGLPGFGLSSLSAMLRRARAAAPTPEALAYWGPRRAAFARRMDAFREDLSGYLLAERLAATLARFDPGAVPEDRLARERRGLFGPPPGAGGACGALLAELDGLLWRLLLPPR